MSESIKNFEMRKLDHLSFSKSPETQALGFSGLDRIKLIHEALPDFNLSEIDTQVDLFQTSFKVPLFISSMTAGHSQGESINLTLAQAAHDRGWLMGVGSQRRELFDKNAKNEWVTLRSKLPGAKLVGNIGIGQLIKSKPETIVELVESLQALALFVHLNPLQEALQIDGDTQFKNALLQLQAIVKVLPCPVIIKEVGCGISAKTALRLKSIGVEFIDVAGLGGTHWGRVEGLRARKKNHINFEVSQSFWDWGISTVDSLEQVKKVWYPKKVWASGGVRSGVDAAKLLALGAGMVGLAQPLLVAAEKGGLPDVLSKMEQIEIELKIAMFCSGLKSLSDFDNQGVIEWIKS